MASRAKSTRAARGKFLSASIDIDIDDDGTLQVKTRPIFKRELSKILREIRDEARADLADPVRHPYSRTGALRRSVKVGPIKQVHAHRISGSVSAGSRLAKHARWVHEGTGPRVIRVKQAKAMKFYWRKVGAVVYFQKVGRPPVSHKAKAKPFLKTAGRKVAARYGTTVH